MERLARMRSGRFGIARRWSVIALGLAALVLVLGARGQAAADDCTLLGGTDGAECVISGVVPGAKTGTFNLDKTLRFTPGGRLNVGPAGITININSANGDFIMENNTLIDGNGANGAPITVALSGGDIDLQTGSIIRSNGDPGSGGFIQITTSGVGAANIDGLVESVGRSGGQSPNQGPGGGPITIKGGCALTISDTGVVSSRGFDAGADLVHLEGCVVTINGRVESTAPGHATPNSPANSCSDAPTNSPRRNPVTRPGKPQNSTGCVEIWSGSTVFIDSTGTHKGEVDADIGFAGGSQGRGWIDILANLTIEIRDGAGNDHNKNAGCTVPVTFAVHANGGLCQPNDDGGLILIQSYLGDVLASGDAIQADGSTNPQFSSSGGFGGEIRVEAQGNVNFSPQISGVVVGGNIFARGDFTVPGLGTGGKIGPTIPAEPPFPGPAPIRAFNGSLTWISGTGDARPTGTGEPNPGERGEINLQACTGVNTAGAAFPVNGAAIPPYPNVLAGACGGAPTKPPYVVLGGFPALCNPNLCQEQPAGIKRGMKFNDLNHDGVKDPGEPPLNGWEIHVFGTETGTGNPVHEHFITQNLPGFGMHTFT